MDENGELMEVNRQQITTRTVIWATVAGIAIEGPILGLMGFSFLSSLMLLVITSPLLMIFSPLLMSAAFVFVVAMAGFGVAGVTAVLGLSSFVLVYRTLIKGGENGGTDDVPVNVDKMIQPAETVMEEKEQHDTEVPAPGLLTGSEGRTEEVEGVNEQQEGTPVTVDKMIQPAETVMEEKEQHDIEVPAPGRTEEVGGVNEQQEGTPVTVDRMVELFESLKEHPHNTTDVPITDETSSGYLQQNVQQQIPQQI